MTWSCEMENWSLCPPDTEKVPGGVRPPPSRNNSQLAPDQQERVGGLESHSSLVPAAAATARPDKTRSGVTTDIPQTPALLKNKGVKNKQALGYQSSGRTAPLCKVPSWSSAERVQNSRSWDSQNHIICRRDRALLRLPICSSGL